MTTLTLDRIITESLETMLTASHVIEENVIALSGDDPDGDRSATLLAIIHRLRTNAARLEGVLIGMTTMKQ